MLEEVYRLYGIGCERLGITPVDADAFARRWGEFEAYAAVLEQAEANGVPPETDPQTRQKMQQTMQSDPFVRAILVGMAEAQSATP